MPLVWDPILLVNLILCVIIVVLGYISYHKSGNQLPLYVAGAFGLFGISHATTLLGLIPLLTVPMILIRTLAYILIIIALFLQLKTTLIAKETQQAWADFFMSEAQPDEDVNGMVER